MRIQPGQSFGSYKVEAPIGSGGQAEVWLVRHVQLGSLAALKVLRMPSAAMERRLVQEGRVQASLRHPNIVTVMDIVAVDDACGLVLEYVDGPSLDRWLETNRPELPVALALFADIVRAVEQAHDHGIVHRDLKPANVLLATLSGELVAKVADFGLARVFNEGSGTRTGATMGTLRYMAPEQVRDASTVDERADIFSLGCLLYEIVCGVPPFQSSDLVAYHQDIERGSWDPPSRRVPGLPARVDDAVAACLAFHREARVPNTRALMTILDGVPRPSPSHVFAPAPVGATISPSLIDGPDAVPRVVSSPFRGEVPGRAEGGLPAGQVPPTPPPTTPPATSPPATTPPATAPPVRSRRPAILATIGLGVIGAAGTASWWSRPPDDSPGTDVSELAVPDLTGDATALWTAMIEAYRSGDEQGMTSLSEQLVRAAPDSADAWLRRAWLLSTLSVTLGERNPPAQREAVVKAEEGRATLSPRDQLLLDIVKAGVDQAPTDQKIRIADVAIARFPDDAEFHYLRFLASPEEGTGFEHARAALRLDPAFAWAAMEFADAVSADRTEQDAVLSQCLLHHPRSPACHRVRQIWAAYHRDCGAVRADVDAWLAGSPQEPRALRGRAQALLQAGAPVAAVRETLGLARSFGGKETEDEDRALLAIWEGDFVTAGSLARARLDALTGELRLTPHLDAAFELAEVLAETGDVAGAGDVATDALQRRAAWVAEPFLVFPGMDREMALYAAQRDAGQIDDDALAAARSEWVAARRAESGTRNPREIWLGAWEATVRSESDAKAAIAALPEHGLTVDYLQVPDLDPRSQRWKGSISRLAGSPEGAMPVLDNAAGACWVLFAPAAVVQAHLERGLAQEALGHKDAACVDYAWVIDRWGGAKPRSITAEAAREGQARLGCGV